MLGFGAKHHCPSPHMIYSPARKDKRTDNRRKRGVREATKNQVMVCIRNHATATPNFNNWRRICADSGKVPSVWSVASLPLNSAVPLGFSMEERSMDLPSWASLWFPKTWWLNSQVPLGNAQNPLDPYYRCWSIDEQHQPLLGTCYKYRISGPIPDPLEHSMHFKKVPGDS